MTKKQIEAFKKITPGPWKYRDADIGDEDFIWVPTEIESANGFKVVSSEGGLCPDSTWDKDTLYSNAIAIAALPDLLDEREKMIAMLKEMREATAAAFRVIAKFPETSEIFEIEFRGIEPGFGARCQKLITEAERGE